MIPLSVHISFPFKVSNKVIVPVFVTAKCNLSVKDTTEKNSLLAHTLIYNKLLGYECMWVLGIICFSPVIHKMFNHVRERKKNMFLPTIIHLKNEMQPF